MGLFGNIIIINNKYIFIGSNFYGNTSKHAQN